MNGRPLSPEHGAPVRVIVPGLIGARSAKWLSAVQVQQQPSDNYFQRYDYKLFPPDAEQDRVDWAEGLTLNDQPVNAVICQPADGVVLTAGTVDVRGYAFAGSRSIERVLLVSRSGTHLDPRRARASGGHTLGVDILGSPASARSR